MVPASAKLTANNGSVTVNGNAAIKTDLAIVAKNAVTVTGDVNAGRDYTVAGGGNVALGDSAARVQQAGGSIGILAGGSLTSPGTLKAGEDLAIQAGTTVTMGVGQAGDDLTITGGGTVTTGDLTVTGAGNTSRSVAFGPGNSVTFAGETAALANQNLQVTSTGGDITTTNLSATGPTAASAKLTANNGSVTVNGNAAIKTDLAIVAKNAVMVTGDVNAGRDYTVAGGGNVALGNSAARVQQAGGSIGILAGGSLTSPGTLKAGEDLAIQAGTTVTMGVGQAGDDLTITGGGTVTTGDLTVTGAGNTSRSVAFGPGNSVTFAGETAALANQNLQVTSTGGDITTTNLSATGPTAASAKLTANNGSVTVNGNAAIKTDLAIVASTDPTKDAVTVTGNVTAGRDYIASAGGNITLGDTAARTQQAGGVLTVTSSGGSIGQGTGALTLASNSDGAGAEALTLTANKNVALTNSALIGGTAANRSPVTVTATTGSVALGTVTGAAVGITAGTSATVGGSINAAGTLGIKASAGNVQLSTVTATGDVTLDASSVLDLRGGITATDRAVKMTGTDAIVGGTVAAKTITVVDRSTGANALRLGNAAAGSGGFALDNTEISRLAATDTIVLDAGTSTAKTQDVAIGTVNFAQPKVAIYAKGTRIDVSGPITASSTVTNLQLGGTATAADKASVIVVDTDSGGLINAPSATVDLRGANIAVGEVTGFLSSLNVTGTGTGNATVAQVLNNDPSSKLYVPTTSNGAVTIRANTLSVAFDNFALFQNTTAGNTTGAVIGKLLSIDTVSATPIFGLFGTIGTNTGNAAALLLGSENGIRLVSLVNRNSSRVNGCIGEGAGCLSTLAFNPSLNAIDAVRQNIFFAQPDFEVPFQPLIGTNNETLFGECGRSVSTPSRSSRSSAAIPKVPIARPKRRNRTDGPPVTGFHIGSGAGRHIDHRARRAGTRPVRAWPQRSGKSVHRDPQLVRRRRDRSFGQAYAFTCRGAVSNRYIGLVRKVAPDDQPTLDATLVCGDARAFEVAGLGQVSGRNCFDKVLGHSTIETRLVKGGYLYSASASPFAQGPAEEALRILTGAASPGRIAAAAPLP